MKQLLSFGVLIFWISSWFPISPNRGAIFLAVFCILGLVAAHFVPKPPRNGGWPSKTFAALVLATLVIGALRALMTWAEGTSADGAIALFFTVGFAGYLLMVRSVSHPSRVARRYPGAGATLLLLLAAWSWASAIGMYVHRGASEPIDEACILVPDPTDYNTELSSIWEMRLPDIVSRRTSPNGSYIWDYHAILVVKRNGQTEHYNWSKTWMRFDALDPKRNPYLPTTCP